MQPHNLGQIHLLAVEHRIRTCCCQTFWRSPNQNQSVYLEAIAKKSCRRYKHSACCCPFSKWSWLHQLKKCNVSNEHPTAGHLPDGMSNQALHGVQTSLDSVIIKFQAAIKLAASAASLHGGRASGRLDHGFFFTISGCASGPKKFKISNNT